MDSTREEDDLEEGPLSDLSSQPEEEDAGEAGATGDEEKPPCFAHLLRKLGRSRGNRDVPFLLFLI